MIELERHIEALLLNNDCVIVPSFGGFMAHHVHAHYEEDGHRFYPPLRTIGFNPQLTINDSLLAQSYVDVYDISYPEALRRIEQEVAEMRQYLANEGQFELSDIGTIYYNHEGTYTFSPCEAGILTPDLYGLSSLEITPLSTASAAIRHAEPPIHAGYTPLEHGTSDIQEGDNEADRPSLSLTDASSREEETGKTIKVRISLIRNLAAACLVTLAFFWFPSSLETHESSARLFGNVDTNLLYRIMPKDVTTGPEKVMPAALEKVKPADTLQETKEVKVAEQATAKQEYFYAIVLASKITIKNANDFVRQLHQDGHQAAKVYTRNNSTKVIYGQYETEQAAYNALNNLHEQKEFTDGWITKVSASAIQ